MQIGLGDRKIISGDGNPQEAKLWIIGEAPGATEDEKGKPFMGGSGQVLDGILTQVGIKRGECFLDNVIQYRPKGNDFSTFYNGNTPTPELLRAHESLRERVRQFRPNVVVALGNEPLFALTGKKGITKWRGSILEFEGIKVIPTIHPAAIMRIYEQRTPSVFDWGRIKEEALTPTLPPIFTPSYLINPNYFQVMETLERLHDYEYLSFDIETQERTNNISCIGFAWSNTEAVCIPICYGANSWWTPLQELAIIKSIVRLLQSPTTKFIAQNAAFDLTFLQDFWGVQVEKVNLWMDTMIAHHCVYPELPKSLAFLCSIYTTHPYHKDIAFEGGNSDSLWYYNCTDCTVTYECAFAIKKEAEEFGTWDFYREHSHKLIKPLLGMQTRGVRIDTKKRAEIDAKLSDDLINLQARLDKTVGHPLNPNSPKQMCEFLYTELKLPKQFGKTGGLTADEDAIDTLNKYFKNPIFDIVLDIRGIRKLLSTYIRAPLDGDDRIRCSYSITGTETGRLSSRESVYGTGTNLQNIPRGELVRSIFIPDEGKIFVNADLSQAEARVVAYLAQEENLQRVFEQGGDIHRRNAARIFNVREEQVTETQRDLAKATVHACNYKIGKNKFATITNIPASKAHELIMQYYAMFPNIKNWHVEVEGQLRKYKTLVTPWGRKRQFFGRWNDELIRAGVAHVPQSTVGDLLNKALVKMWYASPIGWELLLQNHDAVLYQVPKETDPMHIYKFFHHYMELPITIHGKTFQIPCDIKVGDSWGSLHKLVIK